MLSTRTALYTAPSYISYRQGSSGPRNLIHCTHITTLATGNYRCAPVPASKPTDRHMQVRWTTPLVLLGAAVLAALVSPAAAAQRPKERGAWQPAAPVAPLGPLPACPVALSRKAPAKPVRAGSKFSTRVQVINTGAIPLNSLTVQVGLPSDVCTDRTSEGVGGLWSRLRVGVLPWAGRTWRTQPVVSHHTLFHLFAQHQKSLRALPPPRPTHLRSSTRTFTGSTSRRSPRARTSPLRSEPGCPLPFPAVPSPSRPSSTPRRPMGPWSAPRACRTSR